MKLSIAAPSVADLQEQVGILTRELKKARAQQKYRRSDANARCWPMAAEPGSHENFRCQG